MIVLITGATGFLGGRAVETFAKDNSFSRIIATGRNQNNNAVIQSEKVTYRFGDLSEQNFVKSLFDSRIDLVIHCAAFSSPWGDKNIFYKSNYLTTKYLIEESKKMKINRFIYISTPSIYFDYQDKIGVSETDSLPKSLVNQYAKTKYEAEKLIEKSGISFVTLRPRALIGRGDTVIMPRLIKANSEGKLRIMGDGNNKVDLTPVQNMVSAIKLALFIPEKNANTAYNISNGEPIVLWDEINKILGLLNQNIVSKKLPYPLLFLIAYILEKKALLLKEDEPTLTRYSVGVLSKSFSMDITKAREKLGYNPSQTVDEAIEEFVNWYKKEDYENS